MSCSTNRCCCLYQQCQMAANEARFKLRDLLALPMQRVLKYHLFLKVCLFIVFYKTQRRRRMARFRSVQTVRSIRAAAEWYYFGRGWGHVPVTAASFATENAPKCIVSRVKFLPIAKSSSHMVSTTNTTLGRGKFTSPTFWNVIFVGPQSENLKSPKEAWMK